MSLSTTTTAGAGQGRAAALALVAAVLIAAVATLVMPPETAAARDPAWAGGAGEASSRGGAAASRSGSAGTAPVELLLTFRERPGLHAFVKAVSDPRSLRYRQYATVEQLARRFGAPPQARRAVAAWATAQRLDLRISPTGTFAIAGGTRAAVAGAVGAGALARASARAASVPVPPALRGKVVAAARLSGRSLPQTVEPVAPAPAVRAAGADHRVQSPGPTTPDTILAALFGSAAERTGTPRGCAAGTAAGVTIRFQDGQTVVPLQLFGYTPNQFTSAYGHAAMHRRGFRGEGMRVTLLETDGFKLSDVRTFARCFGATVPKITRTLASGRTFPRPGDETTLDLEVLIGSAPKLEAIDVVGGSSSPQALVKGAIATLGTPSSRPDVISISLGICEPALAGEVSSMRAISDVFAVAAGAGIPTLVASGDSGVTGCEGDTGPSVMPAVAAPATSPFVTAVGGTNVTLNAANALVSQRAWNNAPGMIAGGGGGISILFEAPWWQGGARGGAGGRAVPDLAALADPFPGYAIFCTADVRGCKGTGAQGGWQTVGGTSAATPLTAAGVVLATQEARRIGQPPLGLLNPLIYALAGGGSAGNTVSDVRLGSNDVGTAVPVQAGGGRPIGEFSAGRGFDLATGWGSLKVAGFSREAVRVARRQAARADGGDAWVRARR
jgi:kumamolisin